MRVLERWYRRPTTVLAALCAVLALSGAALQELRLGPSRNAAASLSVIIRHHGVGSREIERGIALPLEEALASVGGVAEIRSRSEYGRCRVDLLLGSRTDIDEAASETRRAVDRAAADLPSSAQKPLIVSSSLDCRPVFVLVFSPSGVEAAEMRASAEEDIKPAFARIQGTGEVEVLGGRQREIHVQVDAARAVRYGVTVSQVAAWLRRRSVVAAGGTLALGHREAGVVFRGRVDDLQRLASLECPLPGGSTVPLETLASVGYGFREPETVSRIDGAERVVLAVQSSGTANLIALSRRLRGEASRWAARGFAGDILLDAGHDVARSLSRVFSAVAVGMLAMASFLFLFAGRRWKAFLLGLFLPLSALATFACMALLGVDVDHYVLAGMAVGMGFLVDIAIILNEGAACAGAGRLRELGRLFPPLAAATMTTAVALVPLFTVGDLVSGTKATASSLLLLLGVGFLFGVVFLPSLLLLPIPRHGAPRPGLAAAGASAGRAPFRPGRVAPRRSGRARRAVHRSLRFFAVGVAWTMAHPLPVLCAACALTASAVLAAVLVPKDLQRGFESAAIYGRLELEAGTAVAAVDASCLALYRRLHGTPGIRHVETVARKGGAEVLVRYDPAAAPRREVAERMHMAAAGIGGGFLYLPEGAGVSSRKIEITIQGEDHDRLREIARRAAALLQAQPWASGTVLHFKAPAPLLTVRIDHRRAGGISTLDLARELRWSLHGPVALKWIEAGRETDLRVMAHGWAVLTRRELASLEISAPGGVFTEVGRIADFELTAASPTIYRRNRQRAVSLSVHSETLTLGAMAEAVREVLDDVAPPPGYAIELDGRAARLRKQHGKLFGALALAVVLIYMVLAAQAESLRSPLAVLFVVPTSLAVPLIALWIAGHAVTPAVLVGMIVLSGVVVNNAILVADDARRRLRLGGRFTSPARAAARRALMSALRKRLRPLLLTSATSVLGVLPLLAAAGGGSSFLAVVAFVIFWGVVGSLLSALVFLPALAAAFPRLLLPRPPLQLSSEAEPEAAGLFSIL